MPTEIREEEIVFKIPDSYGFGTLYRITDDLTIAIDIVRIEYSDLLEEVDTNLPEDDISDDELEISVDQDGLADLVIDDATEFHFGVEYILHTRGVGIPLSIGIFTDPAHVVFTTIDDVNLKRQFPKEEDQIHFTGGVGITLNNNLTFDAALSVSEDIIELLVSTVIRF